MFRVLTVLCLLLTAAPAQAELLDLGSSSVKRRVPDYAGRRDSTSAGEVLLWVPRIALAPLYLVSEYVVRRPLRFVVSEAERANLPQFVYDLFWFGPDHKAALLPIAFVDFGFYPSVGLYFFWKDAPKRGDMLQLRAATWGADWLSGSVSQRLQVASRTELALFVNGTRRPDYRYYGVGSDARASAATRYGASRYELGARLELQLAGLSKLGVGARYLRVHFHAGEHFDGDATLDEQIARGHVAAPAGYLEGYGVFVNRIALALDSRAPRPSSQSGLRAELEAELLSRIEPQLGASFVRYAASAGAFWDPGAHGRVLSVSVAASCVDPLQRAQRVPFTEFAALGGDELMPGFLPGRLYGRSSLVASVRYRWPIWVWLDGSLQLATGNVFDAQLRDFAPRALRLSAAIGIESVGAPDRSFQVLVGAGTETFAQGTQVTSLRLIVGTNHGF